MSPTRRFSRVSCAVCAAWTGAVARCETGSKNRRRLLERRARLHGRIAKTRALGLHHLSNAAAGGFDVVAVEHLNLVGMAHRRRRLGRMLAGVSLGELRRQLADKTLGHGSSLVTVGRFFPSSETCSVCGLVKAKLVLSERRDSLRRPPLRSRRGPGRERGTQHRPGSHPAPRAPSTPRTTHRRRAATGDAKRRAEIAQDHASSRWDGSGRSRPEPGSPASSSRRGVGLGRDAGNGVRFDNQATDPGTPDLTCLPNL
jgi:hypothetical protein